MNDLEIQAEKTSLAKFDVQAESSARKKPGMDKPVTVPSEGKSFDYNRAVINQLWPTLNLSGEERKLWRDDLSPLDQDVLYDAIRNAKRTHDGPWPQLKWLLEQYRELDHQRKQLTRRYVKAEPKLKVEVDDSKDQRFVSEFRSYIDAASPGEYREIQERILDKLPQMHALSVMRLLRYTTARFFPDRIGLSRVTREGDLVPMNIGGSLT
jgi:hypothetical protein